jgi:hypothetical protein
MVQRKPITTIGDWEVFDNGEIKHLTCGYICETYFRERRPVHQCTGEIQLNPLPQFVFMVAMSLRKDI